MNTSIKNISTVIKSESDGRYFFIRYVNLRFDGVKNGMHYCCTDKLRIVYESRNSSSSQVALEKWTDNGWVLFANDATCDGAYIEKYSVDDKEKHLTAFEKSCEALLKLWTEFFQ